MGGKKPLMISLSTLLLFTCIISLIAAAPLPRTLAVWQHEASAMDKKDQVIRARELSPVDETGFVNVRMGLEINDYPVSGANSRHDPRNPGRS